MLSAHILKSAPSPFVYVANTGSNNVSVIDPATNTVVATVDLGANSPANTGQIATDGEIVYIPCNINNAFPYNPNQGTVQRINTADNSLLAAIDLGADTETKTLALTPDGKYVYVSCEDPNLYPEAFIAKIDTQTNTFTTFSQPTGDASGAIAITPDSKTAYLTVANTIDILDLTTDTFASSINVGSDSLAQPVVSPDNKYLYVGSFSGSAGIRQYSITNPLAPSFIQNILYPAIAGFTPAGLIITADGRTMYATSFGSDRAIGTIDISNPASPVPGTVLNVGSDSPIALALTNSQQSLYVTQTAADNTIAINTSNPSVPSITTNIGVGTAPVGITTFSASSLTAPANLTGCRTANTFLLQTDFINRLTWSAPASGSAPTSYKIYRDAALTELAGTSTAPEFYDHGRNPSIFYSYYVTAVDSSGIESASASVTVTSSC